MTSLEFKGFGFDSQAPVQSFWQEALGKRYHTTRTGPLLFPPLFHRLSNASTLFQVLGNTRVDLGTLMCLFDNVPQRLVIQCGGDHENAINVGKNQITRMNCRR